MPLLRGTQRLALFYIDIPALRPGTVGAYAFAFVSTGVAAVLRVAIDPYVVGVPFITFFPAVIITTLISGFGAGLFCVVLSTAAALFFLLPPRLSFYIANRADVMDLLLFIIEAFFYVILIVGLRFTIGRYRELNQKLEQQGMTLRE
jgi:K+-sensing histidine kinase KdpD